MSNICHIYDERAVFFDYVASWRLRVNIPAKELRKLGHKVHCAMKPDTDRLNVYHKHFLPHGIEWIKKTGGIFDIVDDNFGVKAISDIYYSMCEFADIITCSTWRLQERILEETGRHAIVVEDPYDNIQYKQTEPEYKNTYSICWFGSETNLHTIQDVTVTDKKDLVTHSGLQSTAKEQLYPLTKKGWNYIPWIDGIMPNIFDRHDIALITYDDSVKHNARSPNRITDALRSGMIVVTNNIFVPMNYGLQQYVVYDIDVNKAIQWVWDNPDKAIEMVKEGQRYVESMFSPAIIAKEWEYVFEVERRKLATRHNGDIHGINEKLRVL